jgi:Family of unknown function (DUF6412)
MSNSARTKILLGIYAIALFALTLSARESAASAGTAAALMIIATLLVGLALYRFNRTASLERQRAYTVRERDRRLAVLRQNDPDAAGHARPRAPDYFSSDHLDHLR